MPDQIDLTLNSDLSEIPRALEAVDHLFEAHSDFDAERFSLSLAVDEILTNIIQHTRSDQKPQTIRLVLAIDGGSAHCTVEDSGPAFDPTTIDEPDVDAPLEEREVGGLGWHFVRNAMHSISYNRDKGLNVLRMRMDFDRT